MSLPAGARRVRLATFAALTTVGCALWAAAFVLAGMLAGSARSSIDSVLGKVLLLLGAVVLVLSLSRRHGRRQRSP